MDTNTKAALDQSRREAKKKMKRQARKRFFKAMFARRIVIVGTIGFVIILLAAIFAPYLTPYEPDAMNENAQLALPSAEHLLGTDNFGRDIFTRLLYGARISLIIGVLAVVLAAFIGIALGMCAAYFSGIADILIMRIMEALNSIPNLMLSLALVAVFGHSMGSLAVILAIATVPTYVRMTRAMTLRVKNSDYVKAAQMQGASSVFIMIRHILPNIMSPNLVMMMSNVGGTILSEASLSFLGVGITIPTPSWGSMVSQGRGYLLDNPYISIVPGICVAVLVICLNMIGDGLRDAMDPRLSGEA